MSERVRLKLSAKFIMRENAKSVYLISLIYILFLAIIAYLTQLVSGSDRLYSGINDVAMSGYTVPLEPYFEDFLERLTPFDGLLMLALQLVASIVAVGYVLVAVRMTRGQGAEVKTLFDGFAFAVKIICLQIVTGFFIFLWSLLLLVPGIIASLRYSLAIYVLADDPTKGVLECIRESKRMMKGRKLDLFVLELSFIGWMFVAGFIAAICALIISLPLNVFMIWLQPYMSLTLANFYNQVSGRAPLRLPPPDPGMPGL
ncbi:MAG: DUF975 family protein [Oscillospiraceae bacterium]|nr:DUF975 family protein [Oscillospiraceae bacterium]